MALGKKRALLLEDNEGIKDFLTLILNQYDYEVIHFDSPDVCPLQLYPECKCYINERCVDVIISDLEMPLVDGLTFVENQKKKGCKAPYVALASGNWDVQKLIRATECGCKSFVKPFKVLEIYEWLDEIDNDINLNRTLTNWFDESTDKVSTNI